MTIACYRVVRNGKEVCRGTCDEETLSLQGIEDGDLVEKLTSMSDNPPIDDGVRYTTHAVPRSRAYPSVGDQLGVIWKVLEAHPELLTQEAKDMLGVINNIKGTFPKGQTFSASSV